MAPLEKKFPKISMPEIVRNAGCIYAAVTPARPIWSSSYHKRRCKKWESCSNAINAIKKEESMNF